jgi:hypothetical protein
MFEDENSYYQHRAEQELELAQAAEHPRAVLAHYQLASSYLERVHGNVPVKPPASLFS